MGAESINLTLTGGNTYYITVSGDRASYGFFWDVSFDGPPPVLNNDPNDQISEAILYGAMTEDNYGFGTIDNEADVDMWSFTVTAGQRLTFDIDRSSGSLDSFLRLFNSSGTELAFNDDDPAPDEPNLDTTESWLEYSFTSAGTYYLGVSAYPNAAYSVITGSGNEYGGNTGAYELYVRDSSPDPTTTAESIFIDEGEGSKDSGIIRVMADFSKAVYSLQDWENRAINDTKDYSDEAVDDLVGQGWKPLDLNPSLTSPANNIYAPAYSSITVTNQMLNGFYTNGNAAAFVAASADALVISFRGTNDKDSSYSPDMRDWFIMSPHYDLMRPLVSAIESYITSHGIHQVYVTGHSLGGAMAIQFMADHEDGDFGANYDSVTFAAPGFVYSPTDWAYYPDRDRVTHIEINGDFTPDLGYHGGRTIHFQGDDDAWYSTGADHSMDYYRQITQSVDSTGWTTILAQARDTEVFLGARISGTSFIVDGLLSGTKPQVEEDAGNNILTDPSWNDYDIYYGGRGNDRLTRG